MLRAPLPRPPTAAPPPLLQTSIVSTSSPHKRFITSPPQCSSRPDPSVRQPKDPKKYASVEDLRRELEDSKGQSPFSITKTIEWLSRAANAGGSSLAFSAYRFVLNLDPGAALLRRSYDSQELYLQVEREADPAVLSQLEAALLIPKSAAVRILARCPAAAVLPPTELTRRLIELKSILPGSDIVRIIELVPSGFLGGAEWESTAERVRSAAAVLRRGLDGADVDAIFEEDPTILFEDAASLQVGIERLLELWDVGPDTLKNSEPEELALAVRALGLTGPPSGF